MSVTWLKIDEASPVDGENGADNIESAPAEPRARDGRRTRAEAKRNQILKVAREVFLKHGYAGTSVDSIVDILGGSKSTIYSHFGNKEGLFAAVIRQFGHDSALPDFPVADGDIRNELIAFAEDRIRRVFSSLNVDIMRIVIAEAARQPEIAELYYRNAPAPTYNAFGKYLSTAIERGDLEIDDTRRATDEFIGSLLMRGFLSHLFGVERDVTDEAVSAKAAEITDSFLARYGTQSSRQD